MLKIILDTDPAGKKYILFARGPLGMSEGVHEVPKPGEKIHVIEATLKGSVYHGEHTVEKLSDGKVKIWEITIEETPRGILVHHAGEYVLYGKNFTIKSDNLEDLMRTPPKENCTIAIKNGFIAIDKKIKGILSWYIKDEELFIKIDDIEIPLLHINDKIKIKSVNYNKYSPTTIYAIAGNREMEINIYSKKIIVSWYEEEDNVKKVELLRFENGLNDPAFQIFWKILLDTGNPLEAKEIMEGMI